MSAIVALRARTAASHALVDDAYGSYDLTGRAGYGAFLRAHARALPAAERRIAANGAVPAPRWRTPLLAEDLAALGETMPDPLAFAGTSDGGAGWGVLYVVEGSRLGGGILAGRVGPDLPTGYLAARHLPGEWRALGAAIDAEAARQGGGWLDDAVAAAIACFDLYRRGSAA